MSLNLCRVLYRGDAVWAIAFTDGLRLIPGSYASTGDLLACGIDHVETIAAQEGELISFEEVSLLSPITSNQDLICQGVNYREHLEEVGLPAKGVGANVIFRKASSSIAAADVDIIKPDDVALLDYEIELGIVLKRDINEAVIVTEETVGDYIGALVIINDISARDKQFGPMQWYKAKSYRTFAPAGPYLTLVDADDLKRFDDLRLTLTVNDEVRQQALCKQMIYRPAATLTELSAIQNIRAGDVIATGTPGGVAMRAPTGDLAAFIESEKQHPERYLKAGDRITASIATDDRALDLGVQTNRIADKGSEDSTHATAQY